MRRRGLILGLGSALAAPAVFAWAQERGRVYRLGNLFSAPRDAPHHTALRNELRRAGFIEGHNLWVDSGGYGLSGEGFDEHAAALAKTGVDVILAGGDAAVRAAQRATAETPILALTDDLLGQGFVRSLAKPGGNTTGVTILAAELDGKRQAILVEAVPGVRHIALLADGQSSSAHLKSLQDEGHTQGAEASVHVAVRAEDISSAIEAAYSAGAKVLNVLASSLLFNNRTIMFERLAALRLPAIFQWPEMAAQGGFIGYGPSIVQLYRDIQSRQLLRLLAGTKPGDLPIEQPTTFGLAINLKIAKALDLAVPPTLLAQADEVIE